MSLPNIPKKRTTFYLNPSIHEAFKKVCEREDVSMSRKLEGMVARYVAVHMKGNPQLPLERFVGEVRKKCYRCEGLFKMLVRVKFISGLTAGVCPVCLEYFKAKTGTVKKVLG